MAHAQSRELGVHGEHIPTGMHTCTQRNECMSCTRIRSCSSIPKHIYMHTPPTRIHADTPMAPRIPQQAAHTLACAHTEGACTYLSPHSYSSQVSVSYKFKLVPRPQAFSFMFLEKRVTM